jgi:hypothetical protein
MEDGISRGHVLHRPHRMILPPSAEKLLVGAALHDAPLLEHQNLMRMRHGGEVVGDHEPRLLPGCGSIRLRAWARTGSIGCGCCIVGRDEAKACILGSPVLGSQMA